MTPVARERSCARVRRALSLVLDDEADAFDLRAVAVHIGRCEVCRRYLRDVSAITRQLRAHRLEPVDGRAEAMSAKGERS
jgi:predicted anti-sigma-YlaC factor YlaD